MAVSQKKAKSAVVIWAAADKNSPAMTCGEGGGRAQLGIKKERWPSLLDAGRELRELLLRRVLRLYLRPCTFPRFPWGARGLEAPNMHGR